MTAADRWVPVGLEMQFPPRSNHPIVVGGYGIALWRGTDGALQAFEDRCPHRGMRLSFGFVAGERLTCLYHGWQWARDGACKAIPAHPDLDPPATIRAMSHATASARGLVYVNLATEPGAAPPAPGEGSWHGVRSVFVDRAREVVEPALATAFPGLSPVGADTLATPDGLALGLQGVGPGETAIHAATLTAEPETRVALARRLVRLRGEIEGSAP